MKELVVISGKGGTGKTSVVAGLSAIVKNKILIDCDVDAADLYLILKPKSTNKTNFFAGKKAKIDISKCDSCGKCVPACRFDAISQDLLITDFKCEGCGVCELICPQRAITMSENKVGEWFISDTRFGTMLHARLGIAEDNSGKLVATLRTKAKELAKDKSMDYIITDGPPGISCPVIASISGADAVLIITEPTPSGIHDFIRAYKLTKQFNVRAYVCINKHDINQDVSKDIEKFCKENYIKLVAKIPYSKDFNEAQLAEKSIIEFGNHDLSKIMKNIWKNIESEF